MDFGQMREIYVNPGIDTIGLQAGLTLAIDAIIPDVNGEVIAGLAVEHAVAELLEAWLSEPGNRERFESDEWLRRAVGKSVAAYLANVFAAK